MLATDRHNDGRVYVHVDDRFDNTILAIYICSRRGEDDVVSSHFIIGEATRPAAVSPTTGPNPPTPPRRRRRRLPPLGAVRKQFLFTGTQSFLRRSKWGHSHVNRFLRRSRTVSERDMLMSLITGSGGITRQRVSSPLFLSPSRQPFRRASLSVPSLVGVLVSLFAPSFSPESPFTSDRMCCAHTRSHSPDAGCTGLFGIHGLLLLRERKESEIGIAVMSDNYARNGPNGYLGVDVQRRWKARSGLDCKLPF